MRIATIVGARPQFIKAAVVSRALADAGVGEQIIHTGQHYDANMSRVFFDELGIPQPTFNLEVGSGSHAAMTGAIMVRLEQTLIGMKPDRVLVYGDTNSTIAGAIVAAKLHLPVDHVEAGLRSYNRRMPEEINRIATDRLSDLLFCPSETAVRCLEGEGITDGVYNTGDVMYDAVLRFRPVAESSAPLASMVPFGPGSYILATVHRAENTDDAARLQRLLGALGSTGMPVVWPVHPRTRARLQALGLPLPPNVHALEPVGYFQMLSLLAGCCRVMTDSGGLQKEAYWMEKPCITLRSETEWTETIQDGWNHVVDLNPDAINSAMSSNPSGTVRQPYGDGAAAVKIADILQRHSR